MKEGNSEDYLLLKDSALWKQSQNRNHERTPEPLPAPWHEHASVPSGTRTAFCSWSTAPAIGLQGALHTAGGGGGKQEPGQKMVSNSKWWQFPKHYVFGNSI